MKRSCHRRRRRKEHTRLRGHRSGRGGRVEFTQRARRRGEGGAIAPIDIPSPPYVERERETVGARGWGVVVAPGDTRERGGKRDHDAALCPAPRGGRATAAEREAGSPLSPVLRTVARPPARGAAPCTTSSSPLFPCTQAPTGATLPVLPRAPLLPPPPFIPPLLTVRVDVIA